MKYDNLYIAGVGAWYPKPVPVEKAIDEGWYDNLTRRRTAQLSATVAGDDDSQPEMAARAGKLAVRQSGLSTDAFGLLLHATTGFCGLDGWNVSSYLQDQVLDGNGISLEVRQQSNGGMAAIELAAAFLAAGTDRTAALVTASDRFAEPVWDRWRAYTGLVLGDGGSAAVLSTERGFAKVLSVHSESRAELEGAQRADQPFTANPDPADRSAYPISLINRMKQFASSGIGLSEIFRRMNAALVLAVNTAAEQAGISAAEADHIVFPNFGRTMLEQEVLAPLGLELEQTHWEWGREIGHAGATDQFGALDQLVQKGELRPGQRVLMTGIGLGFNWTSVVLEITETPTPVGPEL
ncbi:ketoacyl-ACP synthase III family protein [Kitasatospora sp. NPDC002040]|uniref:ketoacyl-ACP synthase III family protein n=1 Tax=Kitasatospora sp. NPDC002040 TaxID=3154661 RepID=UPI003326C254